MVLIIRAPHELFEMFPSTLILIAIVAPSRWVSAEKSKHCVDKSPYCNSNDCTVRPGYSMVYCRKTCGDCKDFCEDSKYITCSTDRKKDCDEMLADYCPKLCGKCVAPNPRRIKTLPVSRTDVTAKKNPKMGKEIRFSEAKMVSNRSFVNPPIPQIDKLDDPYTNMGFPPIFPTQPYPPMWPEPEPVPIQPIPSYYIPATNQHPFYAYNYVYPWNHQTYDPLRSLPYSTPTEFTNSPNSIHMSPSATFDSPSNLANIIHLLGCQDKDETICKDLTAETCLSRPGYYLKLCPVACKNCSGLQCIDSIKMDCAEVRAQGACKLSVAAEYCPRTCEFCAPPKGLAANLSECKDELDTCEKLAESGACSQEFSKAALRLYCAKSCGFCKTPQFYFSDSPLFAAISARKQI